MREGPLVSEVTRFGRTAFGTSSCTVPRQSIDRSDRQPAKVESCSRDATLKLHEELGKVCLKPPIHEARPGQTPSGSLRVRAPLAGLARDMLKPPREFW